MRGLAMCACLVLPGLAGCGSYYVPPADPTTAEGTTEAAPVEMPQETVLLDGNRRNPPPSPATAAAAPAPGEAAAAAPPETLDPDVVAQAMLLSEGSGQCARSNDSIELINLGVDALAQAMTESEGVLSKGQRAGNQPLKLTLHRGTECLGKALRLAPDDYVARLALGVSYLMLAKTEYRRGEAAPGQAGDWVPGPNWGMYLGAAKQQLGYAYMLRAGQYEPLYYLAEVAVEEGDFAQAREFLKPLQNTGYKRGPVLALQGFMAEWEGKPADADVYYQQVLQSGWPYTTFAHALARLATRQTQAKQQLGGSP